MTAIPAVRFRNILFFRQGDVDTVEDQAEQVEENTEVDEQEVTTAPGEEDDDDVVVLESGEEEVRIVITFGF